MAALACAELLSRVRWFRTVRFSPQTTAPAKKCSVCPPLMGGWYLLWQAQPELMPGVFNRWHERS